MNANILVVDDDLEIVRLVALALRQEGYTVLTASNGREALQFIEEQEINLMIVDVMMPEMDGLTFSKEVRKRSEDIPILMLSAKSEDMDRIEGLLIGADDYMTKPFHLLELVIRVKGLLRRAYPANKSTYEDPSVLKYGPLTIDHRRYEVRYNEEKIVLTAKEFDILYLLASHPGQVFAAEDIFQKVWKEKSYEGNNTVMVHISNLREKVDKILGYKLIQTVWGVGYKIEA
ncbi:MULTISPECIES: response regulator transcription factor [Paenibacillus]|uniref:response regulator transcription factor n=1 Tax=Paenibacillus TaxID=44249 RepID=UPI001F464832|nr:response regulator transcription factor [Paenibacillus sp. JJ-223]CAH1207460.1 Transcriptional regulatory protein SrrA [Paenibacillus sp. JJ-223]